MDNLYELEKIPSETIPRHSSFVMPISTAENHYKKNSFAKFSSPLKFKSYEFHKRNFHISPDIKGLRLSTSVFKKPSKNLEITTKIPILNIYKSSCTQMIIFSKGLKGMTDSEKEEFYKSKNKPFKVNDDSFTPEMLINFAQMSKLPEYNSSTYETNPICLGPQPNLLSNKTLIVDLDETLICGYPSEFQPGIISIDPQAVRVFNSSGSNSFLKNESKFIIRPFAIQLLSALSKIYEIIIFTASSRKRAEAIMNNIDPNHEFYKHLRTREDCIFVNSNTIKNVKRFADRDPSNIIMIDNNIMSFFNTLRNGIYIPQFNGSKYDGDLKDLTTFLLSISNEKDVREKIYNKYHLEDYWTRYKELYRIRPNI